VLTIPWCLPIKFVLAPLASSSGTGAGYDVSGHFVKMCDKKKRTSFVWDHFDLCEDDDKVTCLICKLSLSYEQSTSSMVKHVQAKHPYPHFLDESYTPGVLFRQRWGHSPLYDILGHSSLEHSSYQAIDRSKLPSWSCWWTVLFPDYAGCRLFDA